MALAKIRLAKRAADARVHGHPELYGATALRQLVVTLLAALNLYVILNVGALKWPDALSGSFNVIGMYAATLPLAKIVLWITSYLMTASALLLDAHMLAKTRKRGVAGRGAGSLPWLLALLPLLLVELLRGGIGLVLTANGGAFLTMVFANIYVTAAVSALILLVALAYAMYAATFSAQLLTFRMTTSRPLAGHVGAIAASSLRAMLSPVRRFFGYLPWMLGIYLVTALALWLVQSRTMNQWALLGALAACTVWMLGYGPAFWTRYRMTFLCQQRSALRAAGILKKN